MFKAIKKVLSTLWKPFDWLITLFLWTIFALILDVILVFGAWYFYTNQHVYKQVHKVYEKIAAQSGQNQDYVPLKIIKSDEINAYCDGTQIVMYTGLIDTAPNYDEIALVLGHELAHPNLEHLKRLYEWPGVKRQVTEANADKLGAFYMMKAGYDICVGRKFWERLRKEKGNYLLKSHPSYSYRFDELDVNCD